MDPTPQTADGGGGGTPAQPRSERHDPPPVEDLSVEQRAEARRRELDELVRRASGDVRLDPELLTETLEELASAVEELHLAGEELRAQNEELASSRDAIETAERRFEELFQQAPDAYLVTDRNGMVLDANEAATRLLGTEHQGLLGKPLAVFAGPGSRPAFYRELSRLRTGVSLEWEMRIAPRRRPSVIVAVHCVEIGPRHREWGEVPTVRWILRDVTRLVMLERLARRRAERLSEVAGVTLQLSRRLDVEAILPDVAAAVRRVVDADVALVSIEVDGETRDALDSARSNGAVAAAARALAAQHLRDDTRGTVRLTSPVPSGSSTAVLRAWLGVPLEVAGRYLGGLSVGHRSNGSTFTDEDAESLVTVATHLAAVIDNSRMQRELARKASTDPLTGLANRRHVERVLSLPAGDGVAVLAIDVDDLKRINDDMGHEVGDEVLVAVARAIESTTRAGDLAARTGGDEFLAVLPGADLDQATAVARRTLEHMRTLEVAGVQVRVSIGCAAADPTRDVTAVWPAADDALLEAKRLGRDRIVVAAPAAAGEHGALPPMRWADVVGDVLAGRGVYSVYQPIVRLDDGSLVGYEAMCRPRGFPPEVAVTPLFRAARRAGVHRELDRLALASAVAHAAGLSPDVPLFVNVDSTTLADMDAEATAAMVSQGGRATTSLVLEVGGRHTSRDIQALMRAVETHRARGFRFAVGGLGTGRIPVEVLAVLRPEFLKVGRGSEHVGPGVPSALLRSVVALAEAVGATLIVEDVETDDDARRVASLGAVVGQGFLLGRPARADAGGRRHLGATPERAGRRVVSGG